MIARSVRTAKKEFSMKIRIPVYGGELLVVFTDSIMDALYKRSTKPNSAISVDDLPGEPLGYTIEMSDEDLAIFVDTKQGTAVTLAHELIHVCSIVLEKIGMRFCQESEEAYTYLHSMLMQKCMEFVKKNRINPW